MEYSDNNTVYYEFVTDSNIKTISEYVKEKRVIAMKTLNFLYSHKRLVSLILLIIFVLTIVLNMVFNLGIYNYVDSEDVFWNIFRTNGNYEDYEDLQDISMTGETVIQKFYVYQKFNELIISNFKR